MYKILSTRVSDRLLRLAHISWEEILGIQKEKKCAGDNDQERINKIQDERRRRNVKLDAGQQLIVARLKALRQKQIKSARTLEILKEEKVVVKANREAIVNRIEGLEAKKKRQITISLESRQNNQRIYELRKWVTSVKANWQALANRGAGAEAKKKRQITIPLGSRQNNQRIKELTEWVASAKKLKQALETKTYIAKLKLSRAKAANSRIHEEPDVQKMNQVKDAMDKEAAIKWVIDRTDANLKDARAHVNGVTQEWDRLKAEKDEQDEVLRSLKKIKTQLQSGLSPEAQALVSSEEEWRGINIEAEIAGITRDQAKRKVWFLERRSAVLVEAKKMSQELMKKKSEGKPTQENLEWLQGIKREVSEGDINKKRANSILKEADRVLKRVAYWDRQINTVNKSLVLAKIEERAAEKAYNQINQKKVSIERQVKRQKQGGNGEVNAHIEMIRWVSNRYELEERRRVLEGAIVNAFKAWEDQSKVQSQVRSQLRDVDRRRFKVLKKEKERLVKREKSNQDYMTLLDDDIKEAEVKLNAWEAKQAQLESELKNQESGSERSSILLEEIAKVKKDQEETGNSHHDDIRSLSILKDIDEQDKQETLTIQVAIEDAEMTSAVTAQILEIESDLLNIDSCEKVRIEDEYQQILNTIKEQDEQGKGLVSTHRLHQNLIMTANNLRIVSDCELKEAENRVAHAKALLLQEERSGHLQCLALAHEREKVKNKLKGGSPEYQALIHEALIQVQEDTDSPSDSNRIIGTRAQSVPQRHSKYHHYGHPRS